LTNFDNGDHQQPQERLKKSQALIMDHPYQSFINSKFWMRWFILHKIINLFYTTCEYMVITWMIF